MFRFEAEKAARERKLHARPVSLLDEFGDWTRFQKAKDSGTASAAEVPALTEAAHVVHAPVVTAGVEQRALESHEPVSWAVEVTSALELDAIKAIALLKDLLNLGLDGRYPEARQALEATRAEARKDTRSLLRYALALHQVYLHFGGSHAHAATTDLPAVLAHVKTYRFGPYVASLLAALDASTAVRDAVLRHAPVVEALARLGAQAKDAHNPCYVAAFMHAHYVAIFAGNVMPFAELYRRSRDAPGFIPASATSWCVYRVALHNLLVSKRPTEPKKKQARAKALELMRLAQKLDEDEYGARRTAEVHFQPAVPAKFAQ